MIATKSFSHFLFFYAFVCWQI
uniref:Uncharacterized protein n=1 Tax=Arundo donax TaxID=35708 RepID=A0A0A9HM05_ARUDO